MTRKTEGRVSRRIAAATAAKTAAKPDEASTPPAKTAATTAKLAKPAEVARASSKPVASALQKADKGPRRSVREWFAILQHIARRFPADELLDRAAALTYYGFLAVFPTLLLAISVLGLIGDSALNMVLDNVQKLAPGSVRNVLHTAITQVRASRSTGGTLALAGVAGALWSASGYVGAFIRASNVIYGMRLKRKMWKTTPLRIGLTLMMMVTSLISAVIVVFTGPLAEKTAKLIGLGPTALTVWSIAKWPVLALLVGAMIVLLFWAAPDAHRGRFRWISPGSALAVVLWLVLSAGFATYVANFASYNKTYGTVAGVVVFLVWLWLSNLAILIGLEFDHELARDSAPAPTAEPDADEDV